MRERGPFWIVGCVKRRHTAVREGWQKVGGWGGERNNKERKKESQYQQKKDTAWKCVWNSEKWTHTRHIKSHFVAQWEIATTLMMRRKDGLRRRVELRRREGECWKVKKKDWWEWERLGDGCYYDIKDIFFLHNTHLFRFELNFVCLTDFLSFKYCACLWFKDEETTCYWQLDESY